MTVKKTISSLEALSTPVPPLKNRKGFKGFSHGFKNIWLQLAAGEPLESLR